MLERMRSDLRGQIARTWRPLSVVLLITIVLFGAALAIGEARGIGYGGVLRDAYSLTRERWTSVVSNAGLMVWVGVIAVCWFGAVLIERTPPAERWRRFLVGATLVTSVLLIDDALSFHESGDDLWESLTGTEKPSWIVLTEVLFWAVIGALFTAYFWLVRDVLARTEYVLLLVCAGLFGASVAADVSTGAIVRLVGSVSGEMEALEEGLKLLGIVVYASYFLRAAAQAFRESPIRGAVAR